MDWTIADAEVLGPAVDLFGVTSINAHPRPFESKTNTFAPHRPAKFKATKINWEALRQRYVMGIFPPGGDRPGAKAWPSRADVAREFNASLGRVEVVSAANHWPDQRESFRHRLQMEEDHLILRHLASKHARIRMDFFLSANLLLELIGRSLETGGLKAEDLNRLAIALRNCQEVAERAINVLPQR